MDAIDAIKLRMAELGLRQVDLVPIIGIKQPHISELLSRRRGMSIPIVVALYKNLGMPLHVLLNVPAPVALSNFFEAAVAARVATSISEGKRYPCNNIDVDITDQLTHMASLLGITE